VDKKGDYYTLLTAALGGYKEIHKDVYLFLRGEAAGYLFSKFSDLNSVMGGISPGIYAKWGEQFALQAKLNGRIKNFNDSQRNSRSYGGTLELKQQIIPLISLKEGYEYEDNKADSNLFTYKSHAFGIWSEYQFSPKTMFNVGYNYTTRTFDDSLNSNFNYHTFSVGVTQELIKKVYLNAGYGYQLINTNVSNTTTNNHIVSVGLSYSF
jgi:predicted porin